MSIAQHIIDEAINAPRGTMGIVADKYGIVHSSLRREVSEYRRKGQGLYSEFPDTAALIETPPLEIPYTDMCYCADIHAPLHNRTMLRRMVTVAEFLRLDTLVIGGDLFDLDSVSQHGRAEIQAGLNTTLRTAGAILDTFLDYFERIYILPGNHCQRVAKKLDEPLSFELLVRSGVKRGQVSLDPDSDAPIIVTENEYIRIGDVETGWIAGHPMRYSRVPTNLSKAAMRERRGVLSSHTHLQSFIWSDDGKYPIIEPGHMTEPSMTPYVMKSKGLSTFAESKPGFVTVIDNRPVLYGDRITNWGMYGTV